jgi:hypothetical protein
MTNHQIKTVGRGVRCTSRFGAVLIVGAWSLVLLVCPCANAQSYSIDWFTIDSGGGTSTGSVYSLSGTIGQPDAATQPMTGGSASLTSGFWSLLNVVQTPGAPLLKITLTSTNMTIVSWPSTSIGWNLQQNTSLAIPNWGTPAESVSDNGTEKFIIVNPHIGNRFFRLFKP